MVNFLFWVQLWGYGPLWLNWEWQLQEGHPTTVKAIGSGGYKEPWRIDDSSWVKFFLSSIFVSPNQKRQLFESSKPLLQKYFAMIYCYPNLWLQMQKSCCKGYDNSQSCLGKERYDLLGHFGDEIILLLSFPWDGAILGVRCLCDDRCWRGPWIPFWWHRWNSR